MFIFVFTLFRLSVAGPGCVLCSESNLHLFSLGWWKFSEPGVSLLLPPRHQSAWQEHSRSSSPPWWCSPPRPRRCPGVMAGTQCQLPCSFPSVWPSSDHGPSQGRGQGWQQTGADIVAGEGWPRSHRERCPSLRTIRVKLVNNPSQVFKPLKTQFFPTARRSTGCCGQQMVIYHHNLPFVN